MGLVDFKLNDFQYKIDNNYTVIQACFKNNVDVPRFCFHEKLSVAGNCRMCLVEDLKQLKPIASCAVNISNTLFYTNTVKVKKAREAVLEFLLANHPLDCPICDQGGECDLQDQSLVFGSDRGRFYELKRSVEDKNCGPLVKTIMNRCIHCTRCVRFSQEVAGVDMLGITGRGSKMEIGFYIENLLRSELSGNVIDLCPVGALTSKPFSFTSRSWELRSFNTIDVTDILNSNIRVDIRGTKIMRVLPRVNESLNGNWVSDKIRFNYDSFKFQRLVEPMVKVSNNSLVKVSWKCSFNVFKAALTNYAIQVPVKVYLSEFLDLYSIFMVRRVFWDIGRRVVFSNNRPNDFPFFGFKTNPNEIASAGICLISGLTIRLVSPVLNSIIRSSVTKNKFFVYNLGHFSNFTYFYKHISTSVQELISIFEGSHWLSSKLVKSSVLRPLFFFNEELINKNLFFLLLNNTNAITPNWFGLNLVPPIGLSFNSVYEINLFSVNNPITDFSINYLFNSYKYQGSNSFNIFQGSHGSDAAITSNVIFPSSSFVEKNSLYLNSWNLVQSTKKILLTPGNSRDDWKIINAFAIFAKAFNFKLSSSFDILLAVSKLSPIISNNSNSKFINIEKRFFYIYNNVFFSCLNNYYSSDIISQNSKIMSLCSVTFKSAQFNFCEKYYTR